MTDEMVALRRRRAFLACFCYVLPLVARASRIDRLSWDPPKIHLIHERSLARKDSSLRDCTDPNNIYLPTSVTETTQRLSALRQEMKSVGYDAYIVPSEDEHLSEYIAPRDKRRQWISGFTGSQGVAVITVTEAALWTDGRYFLQAERQMDCNWKLMKSGEPDTPTVTEWLKNTLGNNSTVGANPFVFSIKSWLAYEDSFSKGDLTFSQSFPDLIDLIWLDRPDPVGTEIIIFPIDYAGQLWTSKVIDARDEMTKHGADYLLLTLLDEIAWLFNLRGNDIPYTPVFTSYAIIGQDSLSLYINKSFASPDLIQYLTPPGCSDLCVEVKEYENAREDLKGLDKASKIWMSSASTTYGMYSAISEERQIQLESPIKVPKSVKNELEQTAMKQAHIYDGVAVCEYLKWLEENVPYGRVDELSGSDKLEQFRLNQPKNRGPSFGSISASGPNAALIHYGSTPDTNRNLSTDEIYLIDSGGQYFEGTTDITRTVHFGTPTNFQKETFTRVLMGVIDIETAVFPSTLDGNDIGILARRYLYDVGLDYRHGSGHGVGQYLCIHEYPPGIGTAGAEGYPFQKGMFTSIEPGYYQDGEFGIRHENIVMVTGAKTEYHFGEYEYLTLEVVTMVPFQQKMIEVSLLSDKQLRYLNSYHERVLNLVGEEAKVQEKYELYDWLAKATVPIQRGKGNGLRPQCSTYILASILYLIVFLQPKLGL